MSVVEPVFGNIGTNKGLNRFSLRGKTKVQGQWQLFCFAWYTMLKNCPLWQTESIKGLISH